MELGLFTFTGHGFTYDEAIKQAEDRVNEWLKTHQMRGSNNEPVYHFHHGQTLVEHNPVGFHAPMYRHLISVFGPTKEVGE